MAKTKQKRLDFARLRQCVGKAAALAGEEFGEEGLVSYLQHQALKKPHIFMGLLLKLVSQESELVSPPKDIHNITRIELVAPPAGEADDE